MAALKSQIVRKLEKALVKRFPSPATIRLEDHHGVIGVITSAEFAKMETLDRQILIGGIVDANLSPEERRQVQVIVGVTPDEGTGYLAAED